MKLKTTNMNSLGLVWHNWGQSLILEFSFSVKLFVSFQEEIMRFIGPVMFKDKFKLNSVYF